ncbi:MAG: 50S ribosomal protein L25 [Pirellulales bacterium]
MADSLQVEKRDIRGKKRLRRLRDTGTIPAVLYGHKLEAISLSVSGGDVTAIINHGTRMVDLTGAVNESALIRDVQWDTFGHHPIHVDFTRVAADERVEMVVAIEFRGEAPGIKEGGVVQHLLHELQIECPAGQIPEKIEVSINELALDDTIRVSDLKLDPSITVLDDETQSIVHCVLPTEQPEEGEGDLLGESAEPEVIGRKDEEESDD